MTARPKGQPRRRLRRAGRIGLWTAAFFVLSVLVFRVFVGDVYPVSSSSMRPTIFGGASEVGGEPQTEWVFVSFDRSVPERFDLVVMRPENGGEPLVKRVIGCAGEALLLAKGDIFIDGVPLGSVDPQLHLIPLWDSALQPFESWLSKEQADPDPWLNGDAGLVLDTLAFDGQAAPMVLHKRAKDGFLSPEGERVPGVLSVNDLVLELSLVLEEIDLDRNPGLSLWLTEAGDVFSLELVDAKTSAEGVIVFDARLKRMARADFDKRGDQPEGESKHELLAHGSLSLEVGRRHVLALSNLDDEVRVSLDGLTLLSRRYPQNRPLERPGVATEHVTPRAGFSGVGLRSRFERIRILRDLFWVPVGDFGVSSELLLGPDEIFVLGDNSRASTDSRSFGPVKQSRVSGRPQAVVWPPARLRRL